MMPSEKSAVDRDESKRKRVRWSNSLHQRFVSSIFEIGLLNATPKSISSVINTLGEPKDSSFDTLTLPQVKSHLQKYRQHRFRSKKEFMAIYGDVETSTTHYAEECKVKELEEKVEEQVQMIDSLLKSNYELQVKLQESQMQLNVCNGTQWPVVVGQTANDTPDYTNAMDCRVSTTTPLAETSPTLDALLFTDSE